MIKESIIGFIVVLLRNFYIFTQQLKLEIMSIEESNRLIAEFMGLELEPTESNLMVYAIKTSRNNPNKLNDVETEFYEPSELKFHTSWNWLMSVVERIEDIECPETSTEIIGYHLFDVEIRQNVVYIHGADIEHAVSTKKMNTYHAVIEFIELYNENKNQ